MKTKKQIKQLSEQNIKLFYKIIDLRTELYNKEKELFALKNPAKFNKGDTVNDVIIMDYWLIDSGKIAEINFEYEYKCVFIHTKRVVLKTESELIDKKQAEEISDEYLKNQFSK